ncbi:short transient receptor potential channel 4-like isoform X1 [Asterias rubens]|uniref:short transient receptor potential channel 4-like isoform X1 n=2 Tax=Asterias rubens TaxID=7604 RepID=UPI0014559579|nr:short transient receptor potential channel 4-like isoform X1 [Asterias rubens]
MTDEAPVITEKPLYLRTIPHHNRGHGHGHGGHGARRMSVSHPTMEMDIGPGRFDSMEKLFLAAAENGDKKAIMYALEKAPDLNINCFDKDGRSALVIAIQNGNSDIIKVLLEHSVQLGDALLRAVDEQFTNAAQMICEYIKQKNIPEFLNCRALNGDFHPDITPIVLASHHNNYDIIKILLEYGARIEDPEYYAFSTQTQTLQHSLGMLNIYRALASQAYISLTSADPIHTAFEMCVKLRKLSMKNPEFSEQFQELAGQCEQFAADILGHIRNHKEQTCILYHDPYLWGAYVEGNGVGPYKVKIAIHYEQRKFVAHPHCQQRLTQLWYEGLPRWYDTNWLSSSIFSVLVAVFFPILSILYIIYPWGKIGSFMRVPHVQFVCHTSSGLFFLLLLGLQSSRLTDDIGELVNMDTRMDRPTFTEWLVISWVVGLTWAEIKELWYYGSRYLKDRWNILDFLTLSLYWASIALRVVVYVQAETRKTEQMAHATEIPFSTMMNYNYSFPPDDEDSTSTPSGEMPYNTTLGTDITTTGEPVNLERLYQSILTISSKIEDLKADRDQNDEEVEERLVMLNVMVENMNKTMAEFIESQQDVEDIGGSSRPGANPQRRRGGSGAGGGSIFSLTEYMNTNSSGRVNWDSFDPMLISEGLFAIAKVLSFLRPISLTVMNRHVGPMQISLGGMMFDITKFMLIFCFVLFAFSLGMNQLYGYYATIKHKMCTNEDELSCRMYFSTLPETMGTLFWALFGLPDLDILDLRHANHTFTEGVGTGLYAVYHIIAIVVLMNVLIAMMSNTYTRIEEDAEIQWKFSRSKLWMTYFEGRGTIPPPFNVVPTPKTFGYICKWIWDRLHGAQSRQEKKERNKAFMEEREKQYRDIMGKLVRRYIFDAKRDDEEGNQEQWVNRIKQDISGFKYEMFEALSGMDSKMQDMETRIASGPPDTTVGTEMFQKMHDFVKKPLSRPDSMESVKSGCEELCAAASQDLLDSRNSHLNTSPVYDTGELEGPSSKNRYKPKSPSLPANIASYMYPPEWEKYEPIRFIDEDPEVPLLGSPRNSISSKKRGSSRRRRRHSATHLNHIGSVSRNNKDVVENMLESATKV